MFGKYCGAPPIDDAALEFSTCLRESVSCPEVRRRRPSEGGVPREAKAMPILMDPLGCGDHPLGAACCIPDAEFTGHQNLVPDEPALFSPCVICTVRPASIVEIPCGHVNVCSDCYVNAQTNKRCMRCQQQSVARVDVAPFLDAESGKPHDCNICKNAMATVVILPCVHMCLCPRCLPQSFVGCPTCGQRVERICEIQWNFAAPAPSLPAAARALPARGQEGLAAATEDIDLEILRLEQQLCNLRSCSFQASQVSSRSLTSARLHPAGGAVPQRVSFYGGGRSPALATMPTLYSGAPTAEAPPKFYEVAPNPNFQARVSFNSGFAPPEASTVAASVASSATGYHSRCGSFVRSPARSLPPPGGPPPQLGDATDVGSFFQTK